MASPQIDLCLSYAGIAYAEAETGFDATFSNESSSSGGNSNNTATRKLTCKFSDHAALANALLEAYVTPNYVVGAQHPYYTNLFVNQVSVKPWSIDGNTWYYADLTVNYKPLPFNPADPQVIYEDSITVSGEVLPLLKESVTFQGTNPPQQIDRDANYLMCYLTYKRTLKQITSVPLSAVIACLNKVNSAAMTLHVGTNTYSVGAEQVLYNGIDEVKINYTASGAMRFDVTHSFLISPVNLNYEYNANSTAANVIDRFQRVTPAKYEQANMSTLGV